MEDQQAAFIRMLMDRLQTLEQQGVEQARAFADLAAKVDSVLPAVLFPPYKQFTDGYELVWKLGDVPMMKKPGARLELLDARHASAFLFSSMGEPFTVGRDVPQDPEDPDDPENPDALVWRWFNAVLPVGNISLGQFITVINARISNREWYQGLAVSDWKLQIIGHKPRNFP